jgi:hypothetical protein
MNKTTEKHEATENAKEPAWYLWLVFISDGG